MLFILMEETELTGGHIEVILFIEIEILKLDYGRPYWNYAIYRDRKLSISRRPYWNSGIYGVGKKIVFPGGHIEIMLFTDLPKLEWTEAILKLCYL